VYGAEKGRHWLPFFVGCVARTSPGVAAGIVIALLLSACSIDSHFIYMPQPLSEAAATRITRSSPAAEEIVVAAADGTRLHGWLINHRDQLKRPLVIYYGGNADEVSWLLAHAHRFPSHAMLLMNYRGYGRSEGTPHQDHLFADALAIYDAIVARPAIDQDRVIVWGRSLGTGVATYVATQRPVARVMLVSPYDSMTALAARHMPYLKWLLTQPFDSIGRAPQIKVPLLALAAAGDTLIPLDHSEKLVGSWGGPKRLIVLRDGDHNSLSGYSQFWDAMVDFVEPQTR
jgi:uncharacterized protein